MDPSERSMRMRMASHISWAKTSDRSARTAAARKVSHFERFEKQVDPDGTLPPEERRQRAEAARKAFYAELALKSLQARRIRSAEAKKAKSQKVASEVAAYEARKKNGPSAA
ncbi:hypothetical protein [Streptacidiphilus carbonis]|uniref:hypothetical protein n=1 Tax=Streptacidiphilus carbonis TaxID=105422 RepID=UPI0007C7D91E|nr:hypothetical protein [Streptacidiphilus carbonis]